MTRHLRFSLQLLLLVAGVGFSVTACGGGGAGSTKSAVAEVTSNWQAFFSPKTSAARKEQLLQDGSKFAQVIRQGAANPLAKGVGASVSKVTLASSGKAATVVYSITMGGKPALPNETGQAVLQGGVWKVGDASFCKLLSLESVTVPACPGG